MVDASLIMVDFPAFPSWERAIFTEFTERLLSGSRPLAYDLREIALSVVELADKFPKENRNYQPVMVLRTEAQARLGNIQGFIDSFKAVDDEVVDTVHFLFLLQELITHADYKELDNDEFDLSIQELLKSKFKQVESSTFAGPVSRNFVNFLLEGLPIAEELAAIKKEKGEDAIPQDRLDRLYQLADGARSLSK